MLYHSSEIVESFAATRLTPVWNEFGDGRRTACAIVALRWPGEDIPPVSSDDDYRAAIIAGWDDCSLERASDETYKLLHRQRSEANTASVQMRCALHRVAHGRWQQEILAHLIAYGCVLNPMSGLRGRARSYGGRYRRSLDSLIRRLSEAGPWPIYRIVDRSGRVWYATREAPDGPAYPLRSISEIGSEDAR